MMLTNKLGVLRRALRRLALDDAAQVLPVVALSLITLIGMLALGVDTGRAMYTARSLQGATDAAALAGAEALATQTTSVQVTQAIQTYSALPPSTQVPLGGKNQSNNLPSVTLNATLKCYASLKAAGQACVGVLPYNGVQVQQSTVLPMFFFGVFGHPTLTLTATGTASSRGGAPRPSNIILMVDSTLSMNIWDGNCMPAQSQMACALSGVRVLLQSLSPCGINQGTCVDKNGNNPTPFDQVSLFTFPNVQVNTASIDTGCTSAPFPSGGGYYTQSPYGNFSLLFGPPNANQSSPVWPNAPTALPYSFPTPGAAYQGIGNGNPHDPTYQITDFLSDYRLSDTATTLNPNSALVKAAAGGGCYGMQPPNYDGDYGTYYAGALYAAQSVFAAKQTAGTENVLIVLGDGDSNAPQSAPSGWNVLDMGAPAPKSGSYKTATASGAYPSWVGECGQAVTAAQSLAANGTLIYSVAYGALTSGGCVTDQKAGSSPNISPCQTMAQMASAPQFFFSDNQGSSGCTSSQTVSSLAGIFQAIANDLTLPRLIPNGTT